MLKIYVCGPTVYGPPHIGNLRPIVTFDFYVRALLKLGKKVHLTHNITDIDDKIIATARTSKTTEVAIASRFFQVYRQLLEQLNVTTITKLPFVTTNLNYIISFIQQLITKKVAYVTNGNVFFDVTQARTYGVVSNQKLSDLAPSKVHPLAKSANDFVLWKKTTRGIKFASPWSQGRPGWHTECAALIAKIYQSDQLDIHSGGIDLIFPHHENENAQFQALFNKPLTKKWIHIGHLDFAEAKMSKSKGNTVDAKTFVKTYGADLLRMVFLTSSPTKPLTLKKTVITNAQRNIEKLESAYLKAQLFGAKMQLDSSLLKLLANWEFSRFNRLLFNEVKQFNLNNNSFSGGVIIALVQVLGFNFAKSTVAAEDKQLYKQWQHYRKRGNYPVADKMRALLQKKKLI